jgi:hypothetical protein
MEPAAQVMQQAHTGRGHDHPTPAPAGPVQHRPHQRKQLRSPGQPADHLDPAAGLAEGPFIRLVWRILAQCSRGSRRKQVNPGKVSSRQAIAAR